MLTIPIAAELNGVALERLLRTHYERSKRQPAVTFDFSASTWLGVFELSILITWILELRESDVHVLCLMPSSAEAGDFFAAYRFDKAMRDRDVQLKESESRFIRRPLLRLPNRPYYPITFFDGDDTLRALIDRLSQDGALATIMSDVAKSQLVATGEIRDVILAELGDNLFRHGEGQHAHLAMTKLTAPTMSRPIGKQIARTPNLVEQEYFRRIAGQEYVCIVVGDRGPGIANSIRAAYMSDRIISRLPEPSEADLLKYAFLYHTTRRTLEERVGMLSSQIERSEEFHPPTGLFRVQETIRRFGGFMLLRSGSTVLTLNALADGDAPLETFDSAAQIKKLAYLRGTLFKMYFPIRPLPDRRVKAQSSPLQLVASSQRLEFVTVADLGTRDLGQSADGDSRRTILALERVARARDSKKGSDGILIHGIRSLRLSSKHLHYLLLELSRSQSSRTPNVIVDAAEEVLAAARYLEEKIHVGAHPLQIVTSDLRKEVFHVGTGKKRINNDHYQEKRPHSVEGAGAATGLSRKSVLDMLDFGVASIARESLLGESNQIYRRDIVVLLPSRYYCQGFFELHTALAEGTVRDLIALWIRLRIERNNPSFIISIGRVAGELVEQALTRDGRRLVATHIKLRTSMTSLDSVRAAIEIPKASRVLLVADVIGTAKTLVAFAKHLSHAEVVEVSSLVDAREIPKSDLVVEDKRLKVASIAATALSYHTDLPPGRLYSDVWQVDSVSGRLVPPPFSEGTSLWPVRKPDNRQPYDRLCTNEFFEKAVGPAGACFSRHIVSNGSHLLYLFDIEQLVARFEAEFVAAIGDHFELTAKARPKGDPVSAILFPRHNPGLDRLAGALLQRFATAIPIGLSSDVLRHEFTGALPKLGSIVVILDDALASGDTLLRMVEIAEASGVKHVQAYSLLRRGANPQARRALKVSGFGRTRVQASFLVDVGIPTYKTPESCPACLFERDLRVARDSLSSIDELQEAIDFLLKVTEQVELGEFVESLHARAPTGRTSDAQQAQTRWLLECAKTDPWARTELANIIEREAGGFLAEGVGKCALRIISVERHGLILNAGTSSSIFNERLQRALCGIALTALEEMDASLVLGAVVVLTAFDQNALLHVLSNTIKNAVDATELNLLLVGLHLSRESYGELGPLINGLLSAKSALLREPNVFNNARLKVVEQLLHLWQQERNDEAKNAAQRVDAFRALVGSAYHEYEHHLQNVESQLSGDYLEPESLLRAWSYLSSDLRTAAELWRPIATGPSSDLIADLQARYISIERARLEYDRVFEQVRDAAAELNDPRWKPKYVKDFRALLNRLRIDIEHVVSGMKHLQTNLKGTLHSVFEQYEARTSRHKVVLQRRLSDDDAVAFGEEPQLAILLRNLLDNAIEAGASVIRTTIRTSQSSVEVLIVDNGSGLQSPITPGTGLRTCKKIASAYGGTIEISPIAHDLADGFRTEVSIVLHRIQILKEAAYG